MGHQVEYFVGISPPLARMWLSSLTGAWFTPESPGELPEGEFEWKGLSLHVSLNPKACHIRVPQIKYSWLIGEHAPTTEAIARLDEWLIQALPHVLVIRVDELLRLDWESQSGREWHQWLDPVMALRDWLLSSGQDTNYFRSLSN